jgi:hypothetical protein
MRSLSSAVLCCADAPLMRQHLSDMLHTVCGMAETCSHNSLSEASRQLLQCRVWLVAAGLVCIHVLSALGQLFGLLCRVACVVGAVCMYCMCCLAV